MANTVMLLRSCYGAGGRIHPMLCCESFSLTAVAHLFEPISKMCLWFIAAAPTTSIEEKVDMCHYVKQFPRCLLLANMLLRNSHHIYSTYLQRHKLMKLVGTHLQERLVHTVRSLRTVVSAEKLSFSFAKQKPQPESDL